VLFAFLSVLLDFIDGAVFVFFRTPFQFYYQQQQDLTTTKWETSEACFDGFCCFMFLLMVSLASGKMMVMFFVANSPF
jgi:hypothetical protein